MFSDCVAKQYLCRHDTRIEIESLLFIEMLRLAIGENSRLDKEWNFLYLCHFLRKNYVFFLNFPQSYAFFHFLEYSTSYMLLEGEF